LLPSLQFGNADRFVLRGHHATTVDFPALALLMGKRYDLRSEWEWQDSKYLLAQAYKGLSISLWNLIKFEVTRSGFGVISWSLLE
jgi:hypothetical protein